MAGLGQKDDRLLAGGSGDNEDSAIVRFPAGKALVQTVDFFTPIVNDPYRFGQIAAANSLSDVYAMGGQPYTAMNIVCFPIKKMPGEILNEILRGGQSKIEESGAVLAGGHSVEDDEIKYGLSVSGIVDPDSFASNKGLEPGQMLVLTKPIGTGVLATGLKAEWQGHEQFEELLIKWCSRLNKAGADVIQALGLRGATDITGFGLGGHVLEMAEASNVAVELELDKIPIIPEALELAGMGLFPAGSVCNKNFYLPRCEVADGLDELRTAMVFDAQTSGGLVLGIPEDKLDKALKMLNESGEMAKMVGRVMPYEPGGKRMRII